MPLILIIVSLSAQTNWIRGHFRRPNWPSCDTRRSSGIGTSRVRRDRLVARWCTSLDCCRSTPRSQLDHRAQKGITIVGFPRPITVERERGSSYRKERLNIFVRFFFFLSSIHLWRIRWDLGGKVKGKYTHVCFLFFNCTNRAVVVEGKIKSRREVWIIKVVEKSAAVYECCRRWAGNICYHRVKGEFLRKKI